MSGTRVCIGHPGPGVKVTAEAVVAADNFSARYDLDANKALQDTIGIKYLDECFMLTTSYTETFYTDRDIRPDKQVMVRFELQHLGGFNYQGSPITGTGVQNTSESQTVR